MYACPENVFSCLLHQQESGIHYTVRQNDRSRMYSNDFCLYLVWALYFSFIGLWTESYVCVLYHISSQLQVLLVVIPYNNSKMLRCDPKPLLLWRCSRCEKDLGGNFQSRRHIWLRVFVTKTSHPNDGRRRSSLF